MPLKQYFGIADTVTTEGTIEKEGDIMLLEFTHVSFHNEEEILVVSLDHHSAEKMLTLLEERVKLRREK